MNTYKISETITKEVPITFPMYVKSEHGTFMYALMSENNVISVKGDGVTKSYLSIALNDKFTIITEQEFCHFYKETATAIWEGCESFLDMIEEKRHDRLTTPRPDLDYSDEKAQEFDKFMTQSNDHHERQMEAQHSSEPGMAW